MLKLYPAQAAIVLISSGLAIATGGCSSDMINDFLHKNSSNSTTRSSIAPVKPNATGTTDTQPPTLISTQPNQIDLALDKAAAADSISQSAQSADDWSLVVGKWQEAIALMKTVPNNSRYKSIAQKKIAEYQRNSEYARQQAISAKQTDLNATATTSPMEVPVTSENAAIEFSPSTLPNQTVFQIPVKRRESGTPVIDVTFNGVQQFEMIVDTGASSTVITQRVASALGIIPVATAKANTASDRGVEFPIGYVESITVGAAVLHNVPVAIAPQQHLETGLLGHDFFENYDVTFKRDAIEFRSR